jgi:hypothetical protein
MTETLYDQAMMMYQRQDYAKLRAFKKAKKKSWAALGINAEMEARIYAPIKVKGTVTGRLSHSEPEMQEIKPKPERSLELDYTGILGYVPREIHALKGTTSHPTIALMAAVREQEKFRADPRFPLMQAVQRQKRYQAIFNGPPYQPIFS